MTTATIPDWTAQGVLPPIDLLDPTSANRSPYQASITDFVLRFAGSKARCQIIEGLLNYRAALHKAGLASGFQWVDGSFLEEVETLESRPPKDVDVVTFFQLPTGETQGDIAAKNSKLFDHDDVKTTYHVDAYLVHLGSASERLVRQSSYWYSVWSHRRNLAWKGFVEIDLDDTHDPDARALLKTYSANGDPA